jgi:hypothetical protein
MVLSDCLEPILENIHFDVRMREVVRTGTDLCAVAAWHCVSS